MRTIGRISLPAKLKGDRGAMNHFPANSYGERRLLATKLKGATSVPTCGRSSGQKTPDSMSLRATHVTITTDTPKTLASWLNSASTPTGSPSSGPVFSPSRNTSRGPRWIITGE